MSGHPTSSEGRAGLARWWPILRWAAAIGGLAWVFAMVDLRAVGVSLLSIPLLGVLAGIVALVVILGLQALRWRLLLVGYGAASPPPLTWMLRLVWAGFFYNTYLPGGVGGDVVRGLASRRAFGEHGLSRGVAVVLVDRALGVSGLLVVAAVAALIAPVAGVEHVGWAAAAVLVAVLCAIAVISSASGLARFLTDPLGSTLARLPALRSPLAPVAGLLLSVACHAIVAVIGHVLLSSLHPDLPLGTSMTLIPIAMSTVLLPVTVGGAGAREAAFAGLFALVGVDADHAVATSLALFGIYLVVAAVGAALPVRGAEGRGPDGIAGEPPS